MRIFQIFLVTLTVLCCQLAANANGSIRQGKKIGDSTIQGSIIDNSSKKPLGDVTVSFTSARQNKRGVRITDASGTFVFPQMPAGEFTIMLEKKGYKTYRKDFVMIKEGVQLKLSLEPENDDEDSGIDSWNPLRMLFSK